MRSVAQKLFAVLAAVLPWVSLAWPHAEIREGARSVGLAGVREAVTDTSSPGTMMLIGVAMALPLVLAVIALLRRSGPWWGFLAVLVATALLALQVVTRFGAADWSGADAERLSIGADASSRPELGMWVYLGGALALLLAAMLVERPSGHGSALRRGLSSVAAAMCVIALFIPTFLDSFRFDQIDVPVWDLLAPDGPAQDALVLLAVAGLVLALACHGGSGANWIPLALIPGALMAAFLVLAIIDAVIPGEGTVEYPGPGAAMIGIAGVLLVIAAVSGIVSVVKRARRDRRVHVPS